MIQTAKTTPDYQLLASLNIKGIGPNIAKAILKTNTLQELEVMNREQLANLEGIGPERAGAIETELRSRKAEIDELLECLTIIQTKSDSNEERPTVCFTGKMPEKRSYYENLAKEHGYDSADSVTSSLSLLVTAEADSTSSKAVKAAKLGVKVMTLADWLKSLENQPGPAPTEPEEEEKEKKPEQGFLQLGF